MQFTVELYETDDGKCPVEEFIDSLNPKMGAKMLSMLEILEENEILCDFHTVNI